MKKQLGPPATPTLKYIFNVSPAASFYGDGFVQLKATESSDHNVLRVRFRTSSTNGLLFLAAGEANYFLLELHASRLQVKLDLGSGEQVLESDRSIQFNDLAWHSVEVKHVSLNVTLTVDKNSHTSVKIPGPHHSLNIVDGLYVGGSGGLDKMYLPRNLNGFRGCMDEAVFNEHDLLSSLRSYTGYKNVYEVSLGCSPQFFATEEDAISFFSSRAYVSVPTWTIHQEATFQCVVHTSAKEGILLYSSAREGGFVALEIQEGLPVAVVGKGGVKTELRSQTFIDDKKWHSVKLHFSSKSLELTVDGEIVKSSISSHLKRLHLKGHLFVGGIDDGTRSEVRKLGLASVSGRRVRGGSFKGCLKNIEVNRVKMGLSHAVITKDVSVGCEPESQTPANPTSTSRPLLHLITPTPFLYMSTLAVGLDRRYGSDFVQLRNLEVQEGGRSSLEAKHIKVFLDFKQLGVRQSQIMFRIQEQPIRGQIRLDVDQEQEENTFSMLDLWHGRVMYVHGGSEEPDDFFMFSIFCSSRKQVPDYLKSSKLYQFNITVTPTNDAPELSLPEGNLFVLLENSKKLLTSDVLKATDVDSNYSDLVFSVLGNLNAEAGYLEMESNPGKAVTSFSYVDLEELRVFYVHTGVRNSRIVLRVSDGEKVSNTVVLRVMAVALQYRIATNTGLEVVQGETAVISSKQLAVQTNAVKQVVDIRYDVIEPPQFGELQRLHSSGEWRHTESFSQKLLEKERLRYVNTFQDVQTSNVTDYFKCRVNVAARVNTEIVFPITVQWIKYQLVKNVMMNLDKVRKVMLNSEYLLARAEGVALSDENLYFRVLTTPKKGKLLLDVTVLTKNSTFSQRNLTDNKVHYELVDRPYEDTTDRFKFQLVSKHAQSENYDFQFSIKADANNVYITNKGLALKEGESKLITKEELFAETLSTADMFYTVISSPKHGRLARISQSNSNASYDNLLTFTNQDITQERLMYIHDDSETTQDEFTFIASTSQGFKSFIVEDEIGSKEGTFNVSVQLLNDQKPIRVIDKVFHVVKDGQKLLTMEDLCYHDADSDYNDGQLIYTRRGIPLGDLVLANDTSHRLFQFRQQDLEERRVLFIHKGANTGRFVFFVSDGKHFVSSLLDVSADEPYLKVANNTGLLVQKGRSVTISTRNFTVGSNLDIRDDHEVIFKLDEAPKFGAVYHNETSVESFTLADMKDQLISYKHGDSRHLADHFCLTVKTKGLQVTERVAVKVYLESHQRPPIVQHREALLVEEGKPVKIDETKLEVSVSVKNFAAKNLGFTNVEKFHVAEGESVVIDEHKLDASNLMSKLPAPLRSSHEVWFQVTSLPQHGVIIVGERNLTKEKPTFSQFILNKYGITYQHDNSETTQDSFEFSAWLFPVGRTARRPQDERDVVVERFNITVTPVNDQPPLLKVKTPGLNVVQGDRVALGPENLKVEDLDNSPEDIRFSVISKPSNGYLALGGRLNESVELFSQAQINNRSVYFVHDGSSVSGVFYFSVTDGHHKPIYKLFNIDVSEITIKMVNYTQVSLQQGKTSVPLSQNNLAAETNGKDVTIYYEVTRPPNFGKLLMENQEVTLFKQEDLISGRLFYHMTSLSSSEDSFGFSAFTSEANLTGQVLNITVRPLIQVGRGLRIPNGITVKFSSSFLNVSELAYMSDSDPLFEVISHPKYGKVVQTKPKMSKRVRPVESFTFQEVMQEEVALELNANMTGVEELNDSLVFVLKADNIQPAKGEFHFTIVPNDPLLFPTSESPVFTTSPIPLTPIKSSRNANASPVPSTAFLSTLGCLNGSITRPFASHKGALAWLARLLLKTLICRFTSHSEAQKPPLGPKRDPQHS
uniref:Chondroitin sulfate proteoglycan 4ba n=1 Tax=Nothobranchius furzeri TaxID=105023 RepID=A0A8C6P560_NOTFU